MSLTVVSATVKDSDGQAWFRGSWKLEFIPNPSNPVITQYLVDGASPLNPNVILQTGKMDGSGYFSVSLYDNTTVTPIGSTWKLTICPLSSATCGFYSFSASGPSIDISSALTFLLPAPRFLGVYPNYGYADGEVIITNKPGSTYYNVTIQAQKYYNDSTQTWAIVGTGPAGQPGPPGNPSTIVFGQQDPNTLTTQGIYYLPDGMNANAPNPPHQWDSRGGVLEVFYYQQNLSNSPVPSYLFQRYQTYYDAYTFESGEFFTRWFGNNAWTQWVNSEPPVIMITTPGLDLNTFTNAGTYYLVQGSGPNTPNPPYSWNSDMSVLEVFVYNQTGFQYPYTLQRLFPSQNTFLALGSGGGEYYQRYYWWNGTASVWGPWYRFAPVGTA